MTVTCNGNKRRLAAGNTQYRLITVAVEEQTGRVKIQRNVRWDFQRKIPKFGNLCRITVLDSPAKQMDPADDTHLVVFGICYRWALKTQWRSFGGDGLLSNLDSVQSKECWRSCHSEFRAGFSDKKLDARYGLGPSLRKF